MPKHPVLSLAALALTVSACTPTEIANLEHLAASQGHEMAVQSSAQDRPPEPPPVLIEAMSIASPVQAKIDAVTEAAATHSNSTSTTTTTTTTTTAPTPEPEPYPYSVWDAVEVAFGDLGDNVLRQAHRIVKCESNWNPSAKSRRSSASGLWQTLRMHSWRYEALGSSWEEGRFNAYVNSQVARMLYNESGWRPWVCKP